MIEYVCFLRGINVGGVRISMSDLRALFIRLELHNPITYLQTGNVRFSSDIPNEKLKSKIEEALTVAFSYEAKVVLYEAPRLQNIIAAFPFPYSPDLHRYVLLFSDATIIEQLLTHQDELDPAIERIAKGDHVLYWQVPKGMTTDTSFAKLTTKSAFKQFLTVRNMNTLEKIVRK